MRQTVGARQRLRWRDAYAPGCQLRVAQGRRSSPDSHSLLDEKGSDRIDRRCSPRDQAGANAVAGLEIELVLCLLAHGTQVRPQGCFSNRLGIVVIVLLPLHERLYVDRRDDPRLLAQLTQGTADKVRDASIPTTQGRNCLKVSASASRLIFRRKAILPSVPKPTM